MKSLVIVLGVLAVGWAEAPAQDRSSVEETVRSLDDQARIAALKRDIPALERLWSEQLTVNAPNNEVVVGRRAVIDGFVRTGIINFSSFDRQIEFVRVDGDFAAIMGSETVRPLSDAPSSGLISGQTIQRRVTNIWKKEGGTWRLYWRHANVVPVSSTAAANGVEQNKRVIRRLYDELFSKWNFGVVDEVFSPEFISHDMPPGMPRGPEGIRQFYAGIRSGLPDVQLIVEDMIGERDKVVVRWRARATHQGTFLGIPATGKPVSFGGIAIYRLSKGQVVERWVEVGLLGVAEQLRATSPQAPGQGHSSAEETVRSLDDQERIAALKRDLPALERLWSEQFTVNAPNNKVVVGRRAVLDAFVRSGIIDFSSFERQIEFVGIEGDFAVVMGAETVRAKADAPSAGLVAGQTIQRRFTNIWKKEGTTWRLFWRHANVVPSK